jgi:acetate kinase
MGERRILTVNAGSTSVRLGLFAVDDQVRRCLARERLATQDGAEAPTLDAFLSRQAQAPDLVVHRVVHGGVFRDTRRFDTPVRAAVAAAATLAPLHNPATLAWAAACDGRLPRAMSLAAFDSGFFQALPDVATTYGLPAEMVRSLGLKRLGFHGLAHRSMWQSFRTRSPARWARVISLQLGGGCSMAALRDGQPVETSMGFSPLEGLMMATRPGDLDAGAVLYLMEQLGLGPGEMRDLLYRRSGLLGVSGTSSDLRELLASPAPQAALAVEVFCHRIRKYLGAYLAVLGGCDVVLIGGGAGEQSPLLRQRIFTGLEALGIVLDAQANQRAHGSAVLSPPEAPVQLRVIPTDEESILVDEACAWLEANPSWATDLQDGRTT